MAIIYLKNSSGKFLKSSSGKFLTSEIVVSETTHSLNIGNGIYTLQLGNGKAISVECWDENVEGTTRTWFDFSADWDFQIIFNEYHYGYPNMYVNVENMENSVFEFYDINLYEHEDNYITVYGQGDQEAEYIRTYGTHIATLGIDGTNGRWKKLEANEWTTTW